MRQRPGVRLACFVLVCAAAVSRAGAQPPAKGPAAGTITAGNDIYQVHVQDAPGNDRGTYTATTGPLHPSGPGHNLLFGNGLPGTSFNTVRSFTTGTDYTQRLVPGAIYLDPFADVTPLGTTGVRTAYTLPGPTPASGATTPDLLTIVQDVNVRGTTFGDSSIEVTTTIANAGGTAVRIGVRYLWDVQIGLDDGPTLQPIGPASAIVTEETAFQPVTFEAFRVEDNGVNPSSPTLTVVGTALGPGTIVPTPTPPDLLQFACWTFAVTTSFDYPVTPGFPAAMDPCNDSAAIYFFGDVDARAIQVETGASHTVSASLFLTAPPPPAELCDDLVDNDGDGAIDDLDPDCDAGPPPDEAPPVLVGAVSPGPNANGWNRTSVDVHFTCTDDSGSTVISVTGACSGTSATGAFACTLANDGANQQVTATCADEAGNTAAPVTHTVSIDRTPPEVYVAFDVASREPALFARDALSGTTDGPLTPVKIVRIWWPGAVKRTYEAVDLAGNTTTARLLVLLGHDRCDHKSSRHTALASLVSWQYEDGPTIIAPLNLEYFTWNATSSGALASLEQDLHVGRRDHVTAAWTKAGNTTKIVRTRPLPQAVSSVPGLTLLRAATATGTLRIEF